FVQPEIARPPTYRITVGADHKANLLKKAESLGLYEDLQLVDANKRLPFGDGSFKSVFSNIVYWLDEPEGALSEISRILVPGGKCCLMLPNDTLPRFSFYHSLCVNSGDER